MEVTEEEYQRYFRPWWRQKKREQRNWEAMEEKGYTEESYEAWRDAAAEDMGVADTGQPDMDELLEKEMLLGVLVLLPFCTDLKLLWLPVIELTDIMA